MRPHLFVVVLVVLAACDDGNPTLPEAQPPELLPLTAPENLVTNIVIIYNDTVRTSAERVMEFANLLAPPAGCDSCLSFLHDFLPPDDIETPSDLWGRDEEIQAHRNLFQAQDDQDIYSLLLEIQFRPAEDLAGRPGWKKVFATNVFLRILTSPDDGMEVNNGQAEFRLYPFQGRWWLGEWIDRPSQAAGGQAVAVEPVTWGSIKATFRR